MWDDLSRRINALPEYRSLAEVLRERGSGISVCGLYGSARSLVLSRIAADTGTPVIVVAADPVKARDIVEDLKVFGLEGVVSYPEDEILPYDYHDPDRTLTGLQMKALESILDERSRILVCTLRSFLKKVFRPSVFSGLLIDLKRGEEHDPLELAGDITRLGYERHGIVEGRGQFALRGGILDIFEVGEDNPVRLEFEGDEIFSMRDFDIETQRSTRERETLRVRPFHHLAPDPAGIARLEAWLEGETEGMNEEERAKMMLPTERLERGISFFGMEHYAPIVHDVVPLLDYFSAEPLVAFFDWEDIESLTDDFREEIGRRYERTREEGNLYPRPGDVYMGGEECEGRLAPLKKIFFRNLGVQGAVRFGATAPGDYRRDLKRLLSDIKKELRSGVRVFLFCSNEFQRERAEEVLAEVALDVDFPVGGLSSGFRWPENEVLFLSEEEVFGRYHRPYRMPPSSSRSLTYDPSHFKPGDFVVHVNHGIGRYMGLKALEIEGGKTECLDLRYDGGDHLFIPVTQLRMVEKYVASEDNEPPLSRLGSPVWGRTREKARRSAEKVARDLLEIYAVRQVAEGFGFGADKPWQKEMEASFPYEETAHQLQSTGEVKGDMELHKPMDRLLCGDVGFGKTEVAVRAAFKAVLSGKQCAFLVPTTVLAMQHYNTISERLQGYPVNTAMLSRFLSSTKQKKVVRDISDGKVDIVVGTHRLLSKDVVFKDLGLVVIDEEHRFGVRHKERFKKMKKSVDVLSMTATPIPRTLHMAISGIRDISVIDTPPRNRLPIHTEILPFDDESIREAVLREVDRGGQVFFVHNRVQSIAVMEGYMKRLLPGRIRISHAHGQLPERDLERQMMDFLERRFDVLVCTMIIEAGLDFPNVNTIIINRADRFGLAQLYQLRGRVGRSDRKAYAFLLVPRRRVLTDTAVRRLQAISEFDYLGAGYRIAIRDLKIRGAGNLLGHEQSGHLGAVGLDLYTRMLKNEVASLKGEPIAEERVTRLALPVPAFLPEDYMPDSEERMDVYRRLTRVGDVAELEEMRDELRDRFGPVPVPAENMLGLLALKVRAGVVGIESAEVDGKGALRVRFGKDNVPDKMLIAEIAGGFAGRVTFQAEGEMSLTILPEARPGEDEHGIPEPAPATESCLPGDLESLLKILEFYDK